MDRSDKPVVSMARIEMGFIVAGGLGVAEIAQAKFAAGSAVDSRLTTV